MVTSVFLSNNTVFIAGGAEGKNLPKHAESIIYRMPEGSLLNGMITNEQELTEQLRELWRKRALPKDHVRLVLESSHFSVKTLAVPKMKEKEVRGVVLREFAEMEQYEEKLYDHAVLQSVEGGGQDILAVMVNRSYIEGWQKIFHDIGRAGNAFCLHQKNCKLYTGRLYGCPAPVPVLCICGGQNRGEESAAPG